MTHRFDLRTTEHLVTILFQGILDRPALSELETLCQSRRRDAAPVRVLLGAGTTVDSDLLENLLLVDGITVEAESPFLSRWIQRCLQARQSSQKEQP
jgi:hypothetical protein